MFGFFRKFYLRSRLLAEAAAALPKPKADTKPGPAGLNFLNEVFGRDTLGIFTDVPVRNLTAAAR